MIRLSIGTPIFGLGPLSSGGGNLHNRRSMASSLAFNPPLMAKSVTLSRRVTCCAITLNTTSLECNVKLDENGGCTSDVSDAFNKDVCPHLPATSNLSHLLNSMDIRIKFRRGRSGSWCGRWDVFEDAEALYIARDLSGHPKSLHVEKFIDYKSGNVARGQEVNVFGCLRVLRMVQGIELTVGREGPDPGTSINGVYYQGYSARIDLPATLYKALDVDMDVKNEVLKITIPKEEGKWIQNFNLRLIYHTFTRCWRRKLSSMDYF